MSSQSTPFMLSIWKTSLTYSPGTAGYGSWLISVAPISQAADVIVVDRISKNNIIPFFIGIFVKVCI